MTKEKDLDLNEKDQVFIVAIKPSFVAVVYPKQRDVIQKVRKPGLESYKKHQICQNIGVAHAKEERVAIIWSSSISPKMKTQKWKILKVTVWLTKKTWKEKLMFKRT